MYKKMVFGGLLTAGIKAAAKKYFKTSGKKTITDLTKMQPLKSRKSAKTDYARGLQTLTEDPKDKKKLQDYIRKQR
jgi:hypothetical protein